jgi:hypothetical protein
MCSGAVASSSAAKMPARRFIAVFVNMNTPPISINEHVSGQRLATNRLSPNSAMNPAAGRLKP